MYTYVHDKSEFKELRKTCERIILNVQKTLKEYFTFQFF